MDEPVRYGIVHETRYLYTSPVVLSQQLLHLTPRNLPWQHCLEHRIAINPQPAEDCNREDYFCNSVKQILLAAPHNVLSVHAKSTVEIRGRVEQSKGIPMRPWETLRDRLHSFAGEPLFQPSHYLCESPQVEYLPELRVYAQPSFPKGCGVFDGALDLARRIHADFEFDPKATGVATRLRDVFENRHGVCQDFAHLMIGCLRSLGLAARYVSGYILTHPPPGRPRLIGADASHAWVSVYCGEAGWVDIDPTNDCLVDDEHITLAWGRDFSDVTPMRGVILGGGEQKLEVHVTVAPVAESSLGQMQD